MNNSIKHNADEQYALVERTIEYLLDNHIQQPNLKELAGMSGLSEFHFQRTFSKWAGISPKKFLQFLNREYIKTLLDMGYSNMEASFEAGLSSPGRTHELFVSTEAMTPGQYKSLGRALKVNYGFHPSPFGEYLLAVTELGICHLEFLQVDRAKVEETLKNEWSLAEVRYDPDRTTPVHRKIFVENQSGNISLLLRGTNFQIKVWQALLEIPYAQVNHYEGLANSLGQPQATRAAASAVAGNRIAWLIPCHRVIRKIGESGQYRWGNTRKKIILAYEAAKARQSN